MKAFFSTSNTKKVNPIPAPVSSVAVSGSVNEDITNCDQEEVRNANRVQEVPRPVTPNALINDSNKYEDVLIHNKLLKREIRQLREEKQFFSNFYSRNVIQYSRNTKNLGGWEIIGKIAQTNGSHIFSAISQTGEKIVLKGYKRIVISA